MKITSAMRDASIFRNLSDDEIVGMLPCLNAKEQHFKKNEVIYRPGDQVRKIGLVISGAVRIEKIDYWGNRKIISVIEPGQIFGEAYAGMKTIPMEMEVLAAVPSVILFMEVGKILTTCGNSCEFHSKMIRNMVYVLAERNYKLTQKMDHLTQKTTREKLLSYFSEQALECGRSDFDIPLDRQQLADYLSVDRSAMSTELGKMKKDGLIEYRKNHFTLKQGMLG
ncbi:Crp/Fnr family transcriptional regulator [Roseburia sp. MUC/MUC-530-WT-4D]|uniref:Crp/Fnr family transcriptional regulator n=1 Tax=Roseburia porci TaxID=2605790 RepID=A0A6L5YSK0_9FIRM|nr:Crp/Fnr family transcriptional regulator [Roseburia porci]MST75553.1 Crp/Fnr family transcriptional regulator [Roseburia porci]